MLALNNIALTKMMASFNTSTNVTLYIYGGTMPTDASIATSFSANNTGIVSQQLASTTAVATTGVTPGVLKFVSAVTPFKATKTGTATWFAVVHSIPNDSKGPRAVVGTLTDQGPGIAPLYIDNVNIVTGAFINVIQFGCKFSNS